MNNQFVPYEIALKVKEKGFDEPCLAMYHDGKLNMWLQDQYDIRSEDEEDGFQFKNSMWDDSRFVAAPLWQQVIDWMFFEYERDIKYSPNKVYLSEILIKHISKI